MTKASDVIRIGRRRSSSSFSAVRRQYRYAEGRGEPLPEFAAELVRLKVDVIVTRATAPIVAAKQATSVIPIVFAVAADPLGNGLVASLARPGGNLTGLSIQTTDLAGKRLELMRELIPSLGRLGIVVDANSPSNILEVEEVQAGFSHRHGVAGALSG